MDEPEGTKQTEQSATTYLLKVYEECWAQARQIDAYMGRVLMVFLIVVGVVTAAAAALIRFSELTSTMFTIMGIGLIILAVTGLTASLTIPRYRVMRNGYLNAAYLIDKYFITHMKDLTNYLGLQIGGTFEGYKHRLRVDFFRYTMMVIMDTSLMAAGLYAMQNSQSLASQPRIIMPSLPWFLTVVGFLALHACAYFLITRYYKPKHEKIQAVTNETA